MTDEGISANHLPDGWEILSLGDACAVNPRRPRLDRDDDALTSFVPMAAVDESKGVIADLQARPYHKVRRGYTYFEEGDVLFAKITPSMQNGKSAIAGGLIDGLGFGSTEFHVLRPSSRVIPEWVHLFVRQKNFREEAVQYFRGAVGQQRVPAELLETHSFPLPPLDEQHRIVARVEELFARIEEARRLRFTADEDAEALFSAASAEAFEPLCKEDRPTSEFRDLIIDSRNGLYKPQSFYGEGTLIVRIDSFEAGRIRDFSELKCLQLTQDEFDKYSLQVGDVLVNRVNGSLDELGKAAVVHDLPEPVVFESNIMRFRVCRDKVLPEFVVTFLGSHQGRTQIQTRARAIQQFSINQADVGSITVPVPPLPEQRRIVEYLESVQAEVKDLKHIQAESIAELERLEQSILARAFRGEL